jgi:hypothetical protein
MSSGNGGSRTSSAPSLQATSAPDRRLGTDRCLGTGAWGYRGIQAQVEALLVKSAMLDVNGMTVLSAGGGFGRCDRSYVARHITSVMWPRCLCSLRRRPSRIPAGSARRWPHNVVFSGPTPHKREPADRARPVRRRRCALSEHPGPRPHRTAATGLSRLSVMLVMWRNQRRRSCFSRGRDR